MVSWGQFLSPFRFSGVRTTVVFRCSDGLPVPQSNVTLSVCHLLVRGSELVLCILLLDIAGWGVKMLEHFASMQVRKLIRWKLLIWWGPFLQRTSNELWSRLQPNLYIPYHYSTSSCSIIWIRIRLPSSVRRWRQQLV